VKHTFTIGVAATQVLQVNKARLAYRIIVPDHPTNSDVICHGYNSNITVATSYIDIMPGNTLEDQGKGVYQGEVWLIAGTAGQTVYVEEVQAI